MDEYANRYYHFVKLVKEDQIVLNLNNIHHIRTRRAGKKGTGIAFGALLGLGLGAITASGGNGAVSTGSAIGIGALVGGVLGGLFGSASGKTYTPKNVTRMKELEREGIGYGF